MTYGAPMRRGEKRGSGGEEKRGEEKRRGQEALRSIQIYYYLRVCKGEGTGLSG
jgi:hypothetical protein